MNEAPFIFRTEINSFHYLYSDAEYLRSLIRAQGQSITFQAVRLSRSAMLLYILSLEALINRALGAFLPERLRDFIMQREAKLQAEDKWQLLPLLASPETGGAFDTSTYPWSHFAELIDIRNDYVHPKHNRPAYYKAITSHSWTVLPWNEIPEGLDIKETTIVYRQTRIPRDPYAIRLDHLETAKKVVDDMIQALDRLLGGVILGSNWLHADQFQMIYPPGAKFDDLPPDPNPKGPSLPASPSSDIGV